MLLLCSFCKWVNWVLVPLKNFLKVAQVERDWIWVQNVFNGTWTYPLSTTHSVPHCCSGDGGGGRGGWVRRCPLQTSSPAQPQRLLHCLARCLAPVSLEPAAARLCRHQSLCWVGMSLHTVWMSVWFALAHRWVESTLGRTLSGWINTQSILERLHVLVVWHWSGQLGVVPPKASFDHWCAIERPCLLSLSLSQFPWRSTEDKSVLLFLLSFSSADRGQRQETPLKCWTK